MKQFVKNHLKRFPDLYYFIYRINRSIKNYSIKSGYLKNIEKEMEKLILPNPRYIKKLCLNLLYIIVLLLSMRKNTY